MNIFRNVRGVLLDSDGVINCEETPVPGTAEGIQMLREDGIKIVVVTNNSRQTPLSQVEKFRKLGLSMQPEEILISSQVTARHIRHVRDITKTRIYMIGEEGLRHALEDEGLLIINEHWEALGNRWTQNVHPTDVVVGYMPKAVVDKDVHPAFSAIVDHGASFIATNPDKKFRKGESTLCGNGFMVGGLRESTGVQPTIMGKPHLPMAVEALKMLQVEPEEAVVVGDSLAEDIDLATRFSAETGRTLRSVLVRSGIPINKQPNIPGVEPDVVIDDLLTFAHAVRLAKR